MTPLSIARVADVAAARRWHAVAEATQAADYVALPQDPVEELLPSLAGQVGGHRIELWLGTAGDVPVAVAQIEMPLHDNTGTAVVVLMVHPEHRRQGYGRQLLAQVLDRARANGRSLVITQIGGPMEGTAPAARAPGELLARRLGAKPVLSEIRRLLDVPSVDPRAVATLRADAAAHAAGYTLVQWVDRAPEELHEDMATLAARMSTDAPMEDMTWEPEVWDADRYRAKEDTALARGRTRVATAVRHEASGRLVGFSDIGVNLQRPDIAYQWETIVVTEHRGHRLGLLLKAANLQLLQATVPGVRYINTWNAAVNTHMVAINDALGFRPVDRWNGWQFDLPG
ncbi:MAG: GNAT family N-acetyltransferase [Pseudonocardiales bacterium]|nr:MAG: GNAT family N-acetyltransferase [Pseudonocardiales bacterium]